MAQKLTPEQVFDRVDAGQSLRGADLAGIDLALSPLQRADLRRVNLRGGQLQGAVLQDVDLNAAAAATKNLGDAGQKQRTGEPSSAVHHALSANARWQD